MINQEGRRLAWAELAGISPAGTYDDVFMAFAASNGWLGTFNDRMTQYLASIAVGRVRRIPAPSPSPDMAPLNVGVNSLVQTATGTALIINASAGIVANITSVSIKQLPPQPGPEAIINGTFATNITPWVNYFNGAVSWDAGRLKGVFGAPSPKGLYLGSFNVALLAGQTVIVKFDYQLAGVTGIVSRDLQCFFGGVIASTPITTNTQSGSVEQTLVLTSNVTNLYFTINNSVAEFTLWVDNVSLRTAPPP